MTRTRRMNADEVERILERYGFEFISQKGSHRKWRNLDRQLQQDLRRTSTCRVGSARTTTSCSA